MLKNKEGLLKSLGFRAISFLYILLPFKLAFPFTVFLRRFFNTDYYDQFSNFFCREAIHSNMTWLLGSRFKSKYFNDVLSLILSAVGPDKKFLSLLGRIEYGDARPFVTRWFITLIEPYKTGYVMDILVRLQEIRWSDRYSDFQKMMSEVTRKMLEHRCFDFEERILGGKVEKGQLPDYLTVDEYVPNFFRNKELVRTLARELHLKNTESVLGKLDREKQYWESLPQDCADREHLQTISEFYAYRHLTLHTYHNGDGHLVPALCQKTFETQQQLCRTLPKPSDNLKYHLKKLGIDNIGEVKLLSPDWSALIGHCGHLNVHLMMREMGWWSGKPIVLAYTDRIANRSFLSLFKDLCPVLVLEEDGTPFSVWQELAGLMPYIGVSHQIFRFEDGRSMYWNDAGGMAVAEWEAQKKGLPLRDIYDRGLGAKDQVLTEFAAFRAKYGMTPSDWHVCLHMRDASTRGERVGAGESIRNTSFDNYIDAVRFITGQGGWVIRMGSPMAPPLPKMERVIDYARSPERSEAMDLHLMRTARLFIGTTSGFAYVASSFGTPTAMVNAISSVGLLWSGNTRFALKPVRTYEGRLLTQQEVTSEQWRWAFPTHESLDRAGLEVSENSADEIRAAVEETFQLTCPSAAPASPSPLLDSWRAAVSIPGFYGAALPSAYFLDKYGKDFLPDDKPVSLAV